MRQEIRYVGRVQGVGFRATARRVAARHPVSGWVRNEPDGSVLMQIQGTGEALAAFAAEFEEFIAGLVTNRDAMPIAERHDEHAFVVRH